MNATPESQLLRTLPQTPELFDYLVSHGSPPDEILQAHARRTLDLGDVARMQIPAEQGALLMLLARLTAARFAVEIGTFTGYSAHWIARGLPAGATLLCCDISEEWTAIGREFWERGGVADKIDLRIGPAAQTLAALDNGTQVDFAFIDADKTGYLGYYEALVPRLSERGVMVVDNVLWSGNVVGGGDNSADTAALREFNRHVAGDVRTSQVMLPVGDGITLITRA